MEFIFLFIYMTGKPETFPKEYLELPFCFTFHASEKFTIVYFVTGEDCGFSHPLHCECSDILRQIMFRKENM